MRKIASPQRGLDYQENIPQPLYLEQFGGLTIPIYHTFKGLFTKREDALRMLDEGLDTALIDRVTGLTREEVEELLL
jgi:hypothetical protein